MEREKIEEEGGETEEDKRTLERTKRETERQTNRYKMPFHKSNIGIEKKLVLVKR